MSSCDAPANRRETTIAVLTPAGRSAIASLRLCGPHATETLAASFCPRAKIDWQMLEIGRILVGRWRGIPDETHANSVTTASTYAEGEELVVCKIRDHEYEIHCHGGAAAQQHIVDTLLERGCRQIDWTDVAYELDEPRWRRQARIALAHAPTERTALILLDQYDGALVRHLDELEVQAEHAQWDSVQGGIERLLARVCLGQHLIEPWQVVLAGPPNVGKSRLINALVGFERTVVFDTPGTTRDVVRVRCAMDGWPMELSDTAGLRETQDTLEAAGIRRTEQQLASADLVLWTTAADAGCREASDRSLSAGRSYLHVITKADLADPKDLDATACETGVVTSAATGEGIDRLMNRIVQSLIPEPLAPGEACPHTLEQQRALQAARDAVAARDRRELQAAFSLLRQ